MTPTAPIVESFALNHPWIILALPFLSFLLVGLFLRNKSPKASGIVATLSVMAAAAFTYALAIDYLALPLKPDGMRPAFTAWSMEWLKFDDRLGVSFGVLLDPISVMLMVVVTTVSSLVHLYSLGYMKGEDGFGRYFTYLNLFTVSMLGLVMSPNIMQMFVFWELVGASSFLLIGFYYQKPSAVAASKKAFIVTRFADLGFLVGILILGYFGYGIHERLGIAPGPGMGPFDFAFLTGDQTLREFGALAPGLLGISILTWSMALIYIGAAGKSAMFPLHIWLPDAMEGPTPVSALIHAATMVVAGVYLVARMFKCFAFTDSVLNIIATVGIFTSLFAAIIACTQDDIKRVLAFSTLSQLGYMMFALGVASLAHPLGYTASMFHLFTHAFFKALLFLGAGALIHAVHSNDIWHMGGLRRKMPLTHACFAIATLAIAGIWPLSGFFSKDEILLAALESGHETIFVLGLITAGLTAFYMTRIYLVAFSGKAKDKRAEHAHDPEWVMVVPLVILAVLSVVSGFAPFASWVGIVPPSHEHHGINWTVAGLGSGMAILGITLSFVFYGDGTGKRAGKGAAMLGGIYRTIKKMFYVDDLYLFITHRIIFNLVSRPIAWFDRHVVDGGVNLTGFGTRRFGSVLSFLHTGQTQTYASWLVVGVAVVTWALWVYLR